MRKYWRGGFGVAVVVVGLLLSGALTTAAGAAASAQTSVNVAVIPGFQAPHYPGTVGVPTFPTGAAGLTGYHFSALAATAVTPAALQGFDTIVLYGVRWKDLPTSAQKAINAFALTGKVVIWDADSTGSQTYSTFVHPFSTTASGEVDKTNLGSAVTFPSGPDPLASANSSSPLYLDPSALTSSNHLIEDMSVLNPAGAAPDWAAGLIAANQLIPNGGWTLAWSYGSTGNQTGMVIYSGLDADAFTDTATPNYAVKELAIELASPFQSAPVAGCAPNCSPPPPPQSGGNSPGSASTPSGLGAPGLPTFLLCTFAHRLPAHWVHGRVSLTLDTGVAAGLRGQVVTPAGKIVSSAIPTTPGQLELVVHTRRLPSNRRSELHAVVYINSAQACTLPTPLKVDNDPPRLLLNKLREQGNDRLLTVRASEGVRLSVLSGKHTLRTLHVRSGVSVTITLQGSLRDGTIVLVDRAGNRTVHKLG